MDYPPVMSEWDSNGFSPCYSNGGGWPIDIKNQDVQPGLGLIKLYEAKGYQPWSVVWSNTELVYYKKGNEIWGWPIGIDDAEQANSNIKIYPNPASDFIQLKLDDVQETQTFTFTLWSADGRLVLQKEAVQNNSQIDLKNASPGIYLVRLSSDQQVYTQQLVIKE